MENVTFPELLLNTFRTHWTDFTNVTKLTQSGPYTYVWMHRPQLLRGSTKNAAGLSLASSRPARRRRQDPRAGAGP